MAFAFKRSITIDYTKVPNTDRTDFPFLVSGTYTYLKTTGNGGDVQNASGYDIGFYSDLALTTKLKWETERYIATTGEVIYWIKIPTVSHTTDTVIYIAYGDSGITTDQSDAANVWETSYKGVFHLGDGTTLNIADSTVNATSGTNNGATAVAGKIGGGANFDGNSDINLGNPSALQITGNVTWSCWVNVNNFPTSNNIHYLMGKGIDGTVNHENGLRIKDDGGTLQLQAGSYDGSDHMATWNISGWSTGDWHLVKGDYDGTNWNLYFDGSLVASSANGTGAVSTTQNAYIGAEGLFGTGNTWRKADAIIEEARFSDVSRSADNVATEYNNQSSPATFYSISGVLSSTNIKNVNGLAKASVKSVDALAIASVKSINGLT